MKKLLFIILLSPVFAKGQITLPRLENDTLFTSNGYNIYKGQVLHLANGTAGSGYFSSIKFRGFRTDTYALQNSMIQVDKLKTFKASGQNDYSIRIFGTVTYKDGKQEDIDIIMDFEKAMETLAGQSAELTVPEEFRNRQKVIVVAEPKKQVTQYETKKPTPPNDIKNLLIADEIKKLFELYKAGALTKEEYESQKKKLLDRQ